MATEAEIVAAMAAADRVFEAKDFTIGFGTACAEPGDLQVMCVDVREIVVAALEAAELARKTD